MELSDLPACRVPMEVGEEVWHLVRGWGYPAGIAAGRQLSGAVDSAATRISEAFGRSPRTRAWLAGR